ncbi:major cardiolipin synthase ClsA [mine drainage metagenome]|uniref:Major cardiolipin synthase ClsA n=1 Tax=mine drainage metagenome TaxID=410659 RepID=A0A1J5R2T7_9ZZZZ
MIKHSVLVFLFSCIAACTTLSQQPYPSKIPSSAFDHPESTWLGSRYIAAAKPHNGLSGFYVLENGLDGFYARAQLIDKAQASLDLQYFIFREDETGKLLTERLIRAADRGVRIRILVDDGNTVNGDEQLLTLAAHRNIQVRIFNPLSYRGHDKLLRLAEIAAKKSHLDYRMHNKLFVADNAVALIGGRNIGDEYFQVDPESQFGDDDVFTIGPMVKKLSRSFDEYWNCDLTVPAQAVDPRLVSADALNQFKNQLASYRENMERKKPSFANHIYSNGKLNGLFTGSTAATWASAQLVYDSPDKKDVEDDHLAGSLIYNSVEEAVKSTHTELFIVTPFFIPGDAGMKLFRTLREHQVSIHILTNSLRSTPELPAHAGYIHYRKQLLKLGVKLHEVRANLGKPNGSGESGKLTRYGNYGLHAKQYIFDRQKVFLGSMNFDQRSMHLNTEIGLIIDSPKLANQAVERFKRLTDASDSYEVLLRTDPATQAESLVWVTREHGKLVEYATEPSRNTGQRLEEDLMSILPLDDEL